MERFLQVFTVVCCILLALTCTKEPAGPAGSKPEVVVNPQPATVTVGQTATFGVVATGTKPFIYKWQKNGTDISGAMDSSYTTPATTMSDNGTLIRCIVSNSSGSDTSNTVTLTVHAIKPAITGDPQPKTVTVNTTAAFGVIATGTKPFTYKWQNSGTDISGATDSGYTTPATTMDDSGSTFRCIVSNSAGSDTSKAALLKVTTLDIEAPVITLLGPVPFMLNVGDSYKDPGAKAIDNVDGDISKFVDINTSTVNTAIPGACYVTYYVVDLAQNEARAKREVFVKNVTGDDTVKPVIVLYGQNPIVLVINEVYTDPGAAALDNKDGDITDKIQKFDTTFSTAVPDSHVVYYVVEDKAGNVARATRTVKVRLNKDTIPPVITLVGGSVELKLNDPFNDPGYSAIDDPGGKNITDRVVRVVKDAGGAEKNINDFTQVKGTYTIYYTVTDDAGNKAKEKTRKVNVGITTDVTPPVIYLLGSNPMNVYQGDVYVEPGAYAVDPPGMDTIPNDSIQKQGEVVTNIIGQYVITYIARDKAGNTADTTRLVKVIPKIVKPDIIGNPQTKTVFVGQTATFGVIATGTKPFIYKWQKNGSDISGATDSSYTTPAAGKNDSGSTYGCIVSNSAGSDTSAVAMLKVNTVIPPTITGNPQPKTVFVGQTATFGVIATGTKPFTYKWQKNNADISGAKDSSYKTPAATMVDNGALYRCIVSNSAGADTSNTATLSVTTIGIIDTVNRPSPNLLDTGNLTTWWIYLDTGHTINGLPKASVDTGTALINPTTRIIKIKMQKVGAVPPDDYPWVCLRNYICDLTDTNFFGVTAMRVTYKSDIPVNVVFNQADLSEAMENYQAALPAAADWKTVYVKFDTIPMGCALEIM